MQVRRVVLQDWPSRRIVASRHGKLVIRDMGFSTTAVGIPSGIRAAGARRLVPARRRHGAAVARPTAATWARSPQGSENPRRPRRRPVPAPACRPRPRCCHCTSEPSVALNRGSAQRTHRPGRERSGRHLGTPCLPCIQGRQSAVPWRQRLRRVHQPRAALPAGFTERDGTGMGAARTLLVAAEIGLDQSEQLV